MAERSEDYKLGLALGRVAKEQGQRHPAQLKAVIADLLVDQSLHVLPHEGLHLLQPIEVGSYWGRICSLL